MDAKDGLDGSSPGFEALTEPAESRHTYYAIPAVYFCIFNSELYLFKLSLIFTTFCFRKSVLNQCLCFVTRRYISEAKLSHSATLRHFQLPNTTSH